MADTVFVNTITLTDADWFNDVNRLHYTIFGDPATDYAALDALTTKGANIASATIINLTTATGNAVHITGTTAITAVTLGSGLWRLVIFDGILTLTHHATNNNLPYGANITTAAGDRALYWSDGTTVYCIAYINSTAAAARATLDAQEDVLTTIGDSIEATTAGAAARKPAVASVAAHATTCNPWTAREVTLTGGAVTFTDIADAPYVGAAVWVKQNAAHVWTDGAVFDVQGGASYTAAVGDWIRLYATTVSTFEVTVFPAAFLIQNWASQPTQEAAASLINPVASGVQHFHPSAIKAWAQVNGTGTAAITAQYGTAGLIDNGAGDYTITYSGFSAITAMSAVASCSNEDAGDYFATCPFGGAPTTTAVRVAAFSGGRVKTDVSNVNVWVAGDLP